MYTICKPRSCTAWAWTTNVSPIVTLVGIFALPTSVATWFAKCWPSFSVRAPRKAAVGYNFLRRR